MVLGKQTAVSRRLRLLWIVKTQHQSSLALLLALAMVTVHMQPPVQLKASMVTPDWTPAGRCRMEMTALVATAIASVLVTATATVTATYHCIV
jgi:hypothetical protein